MSNEELAQLAQEGDQDAIVQLWDKVKRLVRMKARYRLPADGHTSRIELDDLMQAGYIAMMGAVKDFDPASGYAFTTYLTNHLKSAFARELGYKTSRRDALLQAVSMDAPIGSSDAGDNLTIAGMLEAPDAAETFENMLDRMTIEQAFNTVIEHVERLDAPQADVIKKHYLHGITFREIAEQSGADMEHIRLQEVKGLRKLRSFPAIRKLGQELYADERTNFFLHIGIQAFQSGSGSAVELIAERQERLIEQMKKDLATDIQNTASYKAVTTGKENNVRCNSKNPVEKVE